MLKQHPLRELNIDVKINSATRLVSVSSPTHPTRGGEGVRGIHSAHLEFSAQEYTPTRDFEVVVELENRQSDVTLIPHRRGDDGYFMLQLTPPGNGGAWDRPLLPDGDPVNLLIFADTSASIDAGQRATQANFIGALLASLTPKDTFNLAGCDVTCDWAFDRSQSAAPKQLLAARDFLARRPSLGWSDLDAGFASVLKRAGASTHVIYVGDGIVTTGDADPVAFAKRLRQISFPGGGSFHAVTLGSTFEPSVVKAIASLGGGSVRKITSEQGPSQVARALLGEIAQPALRDIKVEFRGIKAARVYPESLANVPAGTQQILMGRYLSESKDQAGEIIVTGTQNGKPVRFSTRVSLKGAEQGNSFIPRLWARMHLDSLLEQGSSDVIRDEIIALSEEYQIITPYTSLLVLEIDADRERFKVKRRFQMRDGERFFADGRDNAVFDLTQKQMKKAGAWRTALRRSVLLELARLGREPRMFEPTRYGRRLLEMRGVENLASKDSAPVGMVGSLVLANEDEAFSRLGAIPESESANLDGGGDLGRALSQEEGIGKGLEAQREWDGTHPAEPVGDLIVPQMGGYAPEFGFLNGKYDPSDYKESERKSRLVYYNSWLNTLFPSLHGPPSAPKKTKSTWPAPARELAQSLLRTDMLAKLTGGIEIVRTTDRFDDRWGDLTGRTRRIELASAKAWATRTESDGAQTLVSWCDGKEIGVFSKAFQLGRVRASTALDLQPPPLELGDYSISSLESAYATYLPSIEQQAKGRVLLSLKYPHGDHYDTRVLIDTERRVVLSIEDRFKGKTSHLTKYDDFVEAAGSWWTQRIETTNADGKRTSLVTQAIKVVELKEFDAKMRDELASLARVQLLRQPGPTVMQAKKALAAGKAGFDDQFTLLLHFHRTQQWPRVMDHLQQAEKPVIARLPEHGTTTGLRWLRSALLYDSRRHDDLRQRYDADAARLGKATSSDAYHLADHVVGQSGHVLQANEMLALLERLEPLYAKQPAHVQARKRLLQQRASYLAQAGRSDDALAIRKQLAADFPRDYAAHQQYAQALAGAGDYQAAYAWLTRVLVKESKWRDGEEESLRTTYTQLLRQQGDYPGLAAYLAKWVEQNPPTRSAYEQYLSALIKSDQIEKGHDLALRWLKDAQVAGELTSPAEARLYAAIYLMTGNGYQLWTNRVEEKWLAPLSEATVFFARHEPHHYYADQILSSNGFRRSEEAPRVRAKLAAFLMSDVAKLSEVQIRRLAGWVHSDDIDAAGWTKLADTVRERWLKEAKDETKDEFARAILVILGHREAPEETLSFLRLQYEKGPEKYRTSYANQLFNNLLTQPWTDKLEAEAFALLGKLSEAEEPGQRLFASVAALHRLTDAMIGNRIAAQEKQLDHPEKLTRTDLFKKREEIRRSTREAMADRLRKEAGKHPKALAAWLVAESLYLDVSLDRNLKQAAAEAWEHVGAAPAKKVDGEATLETALDAVLLQRYLATLMNLAARKGADAALVDRLAKYFDEGIHADGDGAHWKLAKYRLLIVLDRMLEIEQALRQWSRQDNADSRWQVALGYLLAEQGKLGDAIRELEAVESADELSPAAYRSLSDWYLVQNQREASERAGLAVYQTMPEYALSRLIAMKLSPWHNREGHLPTELDKEVLRMFAVLFNKSASPQSYLSQLQQFYQASRDFRLLSGLPDALIGHSAARVYPFVEGMKSVLDEVRDEATADEIVKRIGEVRPRAKTSVDQRALDLLEVLVERRAAEVVNQPGPHRDKALAALVRASKRERTPGEPRLMADFLASLGQISQEAVAAEQLSQLKALQGEPAKGTPDALHIAYRYSMTLNAYKRRAEAIDILQTALAEVQGDGALPVYANNALAALIGMLEEAGHYARGEKLLTAKLAHPVHAEQRRWLFERLDRLYYNALVSDGDVALGKGFALYQVLEAKLQKELTAETDQHLRDELLNLTCRVYRTAHGKKFKAVEADVKRFAFEFAPPLLKVQTHNQPSLVSTIADTVYDLLGPRDGIVFLLNGIESEPRWLRYDNQDGWSRFGGTLALWRLRAKNLGDVEDRLLKQVLTELRRDLESRESRNRAMYSLINQRDDAKTFWREKKADFAKTAEAVLAERTKSSASVQYIAEYFFHGLEMGGRAIDVLLAAHKDKVLSEEGQALLSDYLQRESRFAESIPILHPLVERRPGNLEFRIDLMRAYFKTGARDKLLALLKQSDEHFHAKDRWGETPLDRLANSTLENELFEQSVAYFKELIPLYERTHANRGIGSDTLVRHYMGLADAYVGLKKTPEAAEAAAGAIVAWGSRHDLRTHQLAKLVSVLSHAPDLDAYVAHLDAQKQDSAILRKAAGQAYHEKKEYAKAIKQLERAATQQPNDGETYRLLVAAHDELGDKDAAIKQLHRAVQLARRDLKLYEELGKRYAASQQPDLAERAYTSIVEAMPTEAESHALLAEIRQKQNRWGEAIAHWEHVARLRALEPTGLLKLAEAQIHEKQWDAARASLRKLDSRTWPPRFENVHRQVRELEKRIKP